MKAMAKKTQLAKRKHPRLKDYDYSSAGAYFVTICTNKRKCLLSSIVGRGLAPAEVVTTQYGKIAEQELLALHNRFPFISIARYVIMPNHIHVIISMDAPAAGASPRPTLTDIVCAYKSITARKCRESQIIDKVFQASFYEHIIRGQKDYEEIEKYILENPSRWHLDKLYSEE